MSHHCLDEVMSELELRWNVRIGSQTLEMETLKILGHVIMGVGYLYQPNTIYIVFYICWVFFSSVSLDLARLSE